MISLTKKENKRYNRFLKESSTETFKEYDRQCKTHRDRSFIMVNNDFIPNPYYPIYKKIVKTIIGLLEKLL